MLSLRWRSVWAGWWMLLLVAGTARSVVVTTGAGGGADTYLNYWSQGSNYGTDIALRLSKNYVPYVKVDVGSAVGYDTVTAADLSFYGTPDPNDKPGYSDSTIRVYGLLDGWDDWGELSLTYANAPVAANPIVPHPWLVDLGTLSYIDGYEGVITMTPNGTALVDFLNTRGPDGLVTFLVASTRFTPGDFFSTKEDHGNGSEAPFLDLTATTTVPSVTTWTGSVGSSWAEAGNWINEFMAPDTPTSGDIVVLADGAGTNYPVTITAAAHAGQLYVNNPGGLVLAGADLTLSTDVLRIGNGAFVEINNAAMYVEGGDVRALVGAYADAGMMTTAVADREIYATMDPCDPNVTIVATRQARPHLRWGSEIVSATGMTGLDGAPAHQAVNGSGLYGDMHMPYAATNAWYARLVLDAEPCMVVEFDQDYTLDEMWVWNYEDLFKGYALKTVRIEYSTDGVNYATLMNGGDTEFVFQPGDPDGAASDVIDFGGVAARFVKLTAVGGLGVGNYQLSGNNGSYILRELRFYRQGPTEQYLTYPDGGITLVTDTFAAYDQPLKYGAVNVVNENGLTGDIHGTLEGAYLYYYARYPSFDPCCMFVFDGLYELDKMWVWNCDASTNAPDRAVKRARIEYSRHYGPDPDNPSHWTVLIDGTDPCDMWHNSVGGARSDVVDLGGVGARALKITFLENYGSAYGYLLNELRIFHTGLWADAVATDPTPPDGVQVDINVQLGWTPGEAALTGQDLWLGPSDGPLVRVADNLDPNVTTFAVTGLDNLQDYTWRVDSRDGVTTLNGTEWSFSTKARLRWNPGGQGVVAAIGSVGDSGSPGVNAVNETGISYDLHDPFQWSNGWYCRKPLDVGVSDPCIYVEFDRPYRLDEMWIWNHDGTSATEAAIAVQTVQIQYSLDGVNYDLVMNGADPCFVLPHGNIDGTADTMIDMGGVRAQYVKLQTVGGIGTGNYGSTWGYKLREMRFYQQVIPADFNADGNVTVADLVYLTSNWLVDNWTTDPVPHCPTQPTGDLDGDCKVDLSDFAEFVKAFTGN